VVSSVTISEIADRAGVSPTTVARVVHNNGYVSKEKREIVERIVRDLGYVPNIVARGLRNQRTNYIGQVLPLNNTNPFTTQVGSAFQVAAGNAGYHVLTVVSHGSPEMERILIDDLIGLMVEAIVFTAQTTCDSDDIMRIMANGIPVVMIERPRAISGIDVVLLDSFEGGRLATEHLASHGHRKIAFIGVSTERHFVDAQRYDGFKSVAGQYGLDTPEPWIRVMSDYSVENGYAAMESILAGGEKPTGVFASSDLFACGVAQCLYDHNLRIPDDISVVGYDNTLSSTSSPLLTSVELQLDQVGQSVIDLIIERRRNLRTGPKTVTLGPRLVDRGSVKFIG